MLNEHKSDCKFKNVDISISDNNPNGFHSMIAISDKHVSYEFSIFNRNPDKDLYIPFNFCPCCGIAYNKD